MSYVKNITAHYRQMLDAIIEDRGDLARASAGRTEHFFIPSTDKTFHRGSTDYLLMPAKAISAPLIRRNLSACRWVKF